MNNWIWVRLLKVDYFTTACIFREFIFSSSMNINSFRKIISWIDLLSSWSWIELREINSIQFWVQVEIELISFNLNSTWNQVELLELNLKSSWVAWTQFLKIVYLLICTEFSCRLNLNSISKNRIITCMHKIFT